METTVDTNKRARNKAETERGFDWTGLAIDAGMWLLQGTMMGLGGAAGAKAFSVASEANTDSVASRSENVIGLNSRKSANA